MNSRSTIYRKLVEQLRAYSPDYAAIERRGARVLPHLQCIIEGSDALAAAKAAYVAARIWSSRTPQVLRAATQRKEAEVRIAAISGARSVARRKGKFEARRASHQHEHCLCKLSAALRKDEDKGIQRIAKETSTAFRQAKPKTARRKRPEVKMPPSIKKAAPSKPAATKTRAKAKSRPKSK